MSNSFLGVERPEERKYSETITNIEQMSKFMHIILVQLTSIGILIPAIVITSVNYFVYSLGDRSYFLAYPMMYVCWFW